MIRRADILSVTESIEEVNMKSIVLGSNYIRNRICALCLDEMLESNVLSCELMFLRAHVKPICQFSKNLYFCFMSNHTKFVLTIRQDWS